MVSKRMTNNKMTKRNLGRLMGGLYINVVGLGPYLVFGITERKYFDWL